MWTSGGPWREAWMRQTRDEVRNSTSKSHKEIAKFIGELGVPHKVERLTKDGYFSVDVYLPDSRD